MMRVGRRFDGELHNAFAAIRTQSKLSRTSLWSGRVRLFAIQRDAGLVGGLPEPS